MSFAIEVKKVTKRFGGIVAVDDCSLEVERGSITGLIGPNGAGKSTALTAVFGLLPVSEGNIHFCGSEITRASPESFAKKGLSYVPQEKNVFETLSVEENLEMGGFVRRDDFSHPIIYVRSAGEAFS